MTLRSILALALILYPSARASGQIPAGMKVGLSQYLQAGYDGLIASRHWNSKNPSNEKTCCPPCAS